MKIGGVMDRPLLSIDPGMNSLGWAYWDTVKHPSLVPNRVGLIKARRSKDLPRRALDIAVDLDFELQRLGISREFSFSLVSEYPAFHGSVRGWATGDLQKLAYLVGVLTGYFQFANFTIVTPNEWKGQLPKAIVIRRLQKRFGPGATQEWEKDVWDAVGIGLWKLGKF